MAIVIKKKPVAQNTIRKSMRIMGIDPSTKTGLVVLDFENGDKHVVKMVEVSQAKTTTDIARALSVAKQVISECLKYGPNFIVVESIPQGMKFVNYTQLLAAYSVRLKLVENNLPYIDVHPLSLKKFVTGVGKGKKQLMLKEAYKRWEIEGTDNEIDAYGLAMFGAALHGFVVLPKTNMESLKNYKKLI